MDLFKSLKEFFLRNRRRLQEDSYDSLLWLVNIIPNLVGFSINRKKISAPFWIVHMILLLYVYGVGCIVYMVRDAKTAGDYIKNFVNISLFCLIANNSWWFLTKRPLLKEALKKIKENDGLAHQNVTLQSKQKKILRRIRLMILTFLIFNYMDEFFIYLPHRADVMNDNYSMTPCVGLEPLTSSPNREVCHIILGLQEITIVTVVLNYQALMLFLIGHTAVMYQMLAYEMISLNDFTNLKDHQLFVKQKLPSLIYRHSLTLDVTYKLKSLYSVPMGVNFGSNAVCISLFFYLPFEEWLQFIPILMYCFLVFFLYCFLCQKLINASEIFERAVYSCGWENFDLKEKKLVYVMLRQAQKPVEILAADIIPVNIYTFATTLQAMFKFVTVVKF
uniref:Odorant receptor n=1 Tax=Dendrolimus kikuchii TaxID=765133 RepID=A0A076E7M4_9NEOP|nr:odorant receptor [Dendrolimus kikuchii]